MQLRLYHNPIFRLYFFVFLCCLLCSCGRKTKNIFVFDNPNELHINKLALPAVQGVSAHKDPGGTLISWFALPLPLVPSPTTPYLCSSCFVGYNVYRLVRTNIIPKHPRNRSPIQTTTFLDLHRPSNKKQNLYLVKAVFMHKGSPIEGPISQIISVK